MLLERKEKGREEAIRFEVDEVERRRGICRAQGSSKERPDRREREKNKWKKNKKKKKKKKKIETAISTK